MNRRPRTLAALLALATAGATLTALPPAFAAAPAAPVAGAQHQVTLITGDKVQAAQRPNGEWNLSLAPAEDRRSVGFRQFPVKRGDRTDWYLVPDHAEQALAEGKLDRELFNITGQIRQGYDDAHSDSVPLLVQDQARQRTAEPGLGLSAVREKKNAAANFWREFSTARSAGARKLWLNARVQKSLDTSVPQAGAPSAWQSGYTGKGVTVAVLDTGIDDTHPDVAGKVKQSKDFSGKGNVKDGHGHGTHVAATAVGSGQAEGGKFKGVAPDADLAVGKVLDDRGWGQLSDIIAGMEWAAAEVKAKVVNLSLGADGNGDGSDPVSQAANTLSRKHGTLFVAAAGNDGRPGTISSPAAADLALAVGSVTKSSDRSDFSSQGPRVGDGAVKPEISAPGSDIVAARASGTGMGTPVNEGYTKASGTSMATPHVAGGAAILAQQHPDWNHEQLKAALVATAKPVADNGVFAVGSGQLDLAKATGNPVQATPAAHNVFLKWPSTKAQERTVTYANPGSTPITLALQLELADAQGAAAPAGLAKLSANSVTVPAGGKAEVKVALTPRAAKAGSYGGTLTATGGGTSVRTLIGAHEEGEHHDVTTKVLRRDGKPATAADGRFSLTRISDGEHFSVPVNGTGRVPPGEYVAYGEVITPNPSGLLSISDYAHPKLRVGGPTSIAFDARLAKQHKITVDEPSVKAGFWAVYMRQLSSGRPLSGRLMPVDFTEYSTYSPPGVSNPEFGFLSIQQREEPKVELSAEGAQREEYGASWLRGSREDALNLKAPSVHGGTGTPAELSTVDAKGKVVVLGLPGETTYDEVYQRIRNVKAAGGIAAALYVTEGGSLRASGKHAAEEFPAVLPSVRVSDGFGTRLVAHAKTGGTLSLIGRTSSKHRFELAFPSIGRMPDRPEQHLRKSQLAAVTMAHHGYSDTEPPVTSAYADFPGGSLNAMTYRSAGAAERVEYFTPGKWELEVGGWQRGSGHLRGEVRLEAGKSYRQEWNKAVNGPGFSGTTSNELGKDHPWVWAKGDKIDVTIPWWTDAAGHPRVAQPMSPFDKGSTVLYGDDVELGRNDSPGIGVFPRGKARAYRLESEVTREVEWWRTSTKVSSKWTFGSTPAANGALPLLNIRYAPAVGLNNLAPGNREFTIPVTVPRQDGPAKVTGLAVDYSTDEGRTWQQAKVDKTATGWQVTVRNPSSGFISLRGKASDGKNSVEQTILKAYEIG